MLDVRLLDGQTPANSFNTSFSGDDVRQVFSLAPQLLESLLHLLRQLEEDIWRQSIQVLRDPTRLYTTSYGSDDPNHIKLSSSNVIASALWLVFVLRLADEGQ